MRFPSFWALLILVILKTNVFAKAAKNNDADLVQPLIDWIISKGGTLYEGMEIRRADGAHNGMFAKEDIPQGTLLFQIPRETIINAGPDTDQDDDPAIWCETAFTLAQAWRDGDKSDLAPYANYLRSINAGQLPSAWTVEGRTILLEMLGTLPPHDPISWIDPGWYEYCDESRDPLGVRAAVFLIQRGWDDLMIPLYDMINHRNGKWYNTEMYDSVHDWSKPIRVYTSRDIQAGEELYSSYSHCEDCGRREFGYGTPEILRDYGFVEQYPRRWFLKHGVAFELDQDENGELRLSWLEDYGPSQDAISYLTEQLKRLHEFQRIEEFSSNIPQHELETLRNYRDALMVAMDYALTFACGHNENSETKACVQAIEYMRCRADNGRGASCPLLKQYDDLDEKPDDINYAIYTCDTDVSMSFEGFDVVDRLSSHYQDIEFLRHRENNNVCFTIGNIIQICDSYRPQYHEMMVHYTARFLKDIKRILWVGGGDSMLLHEMLKYPSLELAVGLELDQTITRYAFKHMGAQPHWDNEKVQWWYGDAAKSLLMLPADYFGSFDMILVDLSETVMSLSVTDELDILQALSLLLKPDGIFVKNELYMDHLSSMFRYSFQMHYPWVPVVCSQCMVFGSNRIDFLYDELRDHDLEGNLYIKPLSSIPEPYEFYHDYSHNRTADILCKEGDKPEPEPTKQTRSPGILMIVEVEDAGAKLKDHKAVLNAVEKSLKKKGFRPMARQQSTSNEKAVLTVILEEGYVIVRTFPAEKYAAIDIHLWSSFDKQEAAKEAIVKALKGRGGKSTSSYRIVAGGMFGVSTWKDEERKRGPRAIDPCIKDALAPQEKAMARTVGEIIIEEAIGALVPSDHVVVAVLCGEKDKSCKSADVLMDSGMAQVVPLWSCPGLGDASEFQEGAVERMVACEAELTRTLLESVSMGDMIRAFVVDPSATYPLARVVYEVLKMNKERLLGSEVLAMSVMLDSNESWRRNLMERFRADVIVQDPNFRAEILFNGTYSTVEFGVTTSVDDNFVRRLVNMTASVEERTGLDSDVRMIKGGQYVEDPDWEWENFFLPEDFEQGPSLEQWVSQKPLGYQVLFQLEKEDGASIELSTESIKDAFTKALTKTASEIDELEGLEKVELHVSTGTGEGSVLVALWPGGSCIVLWDGRSHVDLNWFTYEEWWELSMVFSDNFRSMFPADALTIALLDEQPRGIGRVVNFLSDFGDADEPRLHPYWAKSEK